MEETADCGVVTSVSGEDTCFATSTRPPAAVEHGETPRRRAFCAE